MTKLHISTTINNKPKKFLCAPNKTILDILHNQLNLTSSKKNYNSGDYSTCSITLNKTLVCSCLILAAKAENKEITTIKGITESEHLHPLQQHFLKKTALQCSICTPNMLITTKALLNENPNPTETKVQFWLTGNLCQYTNYNKIIHAILDTTAEIQKAAQ